MTGSGVSNWACASGSPSVFAASLAATTEAPPRPSSRRGRIPERAYRPELVTRPLCLRRKASPFWIMLLLVWAHPEHLEPLTLNQRVQGPSPCAPTNQAPNQGFLAIGGEARAAQPRSFVTTAELTAKRAMASAAPGTTCGTPSSSHAAPMAHAGYMSTPLRCSLARPTAARRSRSGCMPSRDRWRGRPRF